MCTMKKRLVLFAILALYLGLSSTCSYAGYTIDGDLSDWGVSPFVDWTPDNPTADYTQEDNTNRPYSDGFYEPWDLEAIYFDNAISKLDNKHYLYFAIVSSSTYASHWASEDLGIDLDGDGFYEFGAEIGNSALNSLSQKGLYAMDYWQGLTGRNPNGSWNAAGREFPYSIHPTKWINHKIYNPNATAPYTNTLLGTYELYNGFAGAIESVYHSNTYIIEAKIDASLFGDIDCGSPIELYLPRVTCLKDWITVEGDIDGVCPEGNGVIPEPSTMLLLGFGLVGAGVFRRKRIKS